MDRTNLDNKNTKAGERERDAAPGTEPQKQQAALEEGRDYYLENGLFVFTAAFLAKRGYCCESGCRHCPYLSE